MLLKEIVQGFINHPYPLWEANLTELLVQERWVELGINHQINSGNYSTVACIYNNGNDKIPFIKNQPIISFDGGNRVVHLESPSFDYLQTFYDEHGLVLLSENELTSSHAASKIKSALNTVDQVPLATACINKLIRSIHILKQEDVEIDVSYSHPVIPFSIFVSICQDNSMLSNLRVAESILHEAMHLKLTLIEEITPMVKSTTAGLYFSPWREEKRPAQGVLHGLFVFSAIHDFYLQMLAKFSDLKDVNSYLIFRIEDIEKELKSLDDFPNASDLTPEGKMLATKLLLNLNPLNNQ
jgi:hypothetical protein